LPRDGILLDLWVDARPGYRPDAGERTAHDMLATASWRGWLLQDDWGLSPNDEAHGAKDMPSRAAFDDVDGDGEEDEPITVTGERPKNLGTGDETGDAGGGGNYPGTPGGGGSGGTPPLTPNCGNSNQIEGKTAPDGGKYLAPENVTDGYLQSAIDYIVDVARDQGKSAVLRAIYNMYENPSDPHFIDFKDWGTANGPAGSVGAGNVTYFSTSLGEYVTGNAFEAFGNFFFGVICTMAGLATEETWAIAALSQSGRLNEIANGDLTALIEAIVLGDDPQDRPFVNDGIVTAAAYKADEVANGSRFGVKEGSCPNGG